ncbi:hypothetical protein J3A83DRAFT_4359976 [Scleroderma citrinum]
MNQGVTTGSEISLASLSTSTPFIHFLVTTIMQIENLYYVTTPLMAIKEKLIIKDHFLLDGASPLPHPQKFPDDWSPYYDQMEFELADFLFTHAEMPIWITLMLELDLYNIIDNICIGDVKWENFSVHYSGDQDNDAAPWMSDMYDVCPGFTDQIDYILYQKYNTTNDQRCWQDFMSRDWAWEGIIQDDPTTARAMLVPIILGSNKTMVSVATGQTDYYLLYLSIENLFHSSLTCILFSLCPVMKVSEVVLCGDNYYQHVIYKLAAYIADYEEQVLLSCIHTDTVIEEFELHKLWDKYGIVGDLVPFTNNFPCADIHQMLSLDILHQLIKGRFKDHLMDWVEKYLIHIHGQVKAEKILDDIDWQIAAVAPFTGLQHFPQGQHFKQWTINDSKGLMKVYIAAIEGHVPKDVDVLQHCHHFQEVFQNASVVNSFSLPQQHLMKHYHYLICQFGVPNGLYSSITKSKNMHTNCFQALGQMILINQRLDKLTAHGMLNGMCVSHVLEALGQCTDIEEGGYNALDMELSTASCEEDMGETVDTSMRIDAHDVAGLASELNLPQFLNILHCFFHLQLNPTDGCDPEDHLLDECSFHDGKLHVFNSACSTFFTPSDLNEIHGMYHKHIHSCPMWRDEGPHLDCAFVVTDPQAQGMHGLDVACVLCFFSSKYLEKEYLHYWDGPDEATGMWIVCPGY